jgi:hypothetical protein
LTVQIDADEGEVNVIADALSEFEEYVAVNVSPVKNLAVLESG